MNVLLIGKGAREHALAWKMRQSPLLGRLYLLPGNPLLKRFGEPLRTSGADLKEVVSAARRTGIDLVVCGPEGPLADGIADEFAAAGIRVFGPDKATARLESSKAYAKNVMQEAGIPTAAFEIVEGEAACHEAAARWVKERGGVVIKASGLAAGKGVFVCQTEGDVREALRRLYAGSMSEAARTVVLEELLVGRECSYFTLLGRGESTPVGFAVDFKRLGNGDTGPNTGGMGCYTPVAWLPENATQLVEEQVVAPLIRQLAKDNLQYVGCLFVGLMWTKGGLKVIEFNVRFGDPEAEVLAVADDRDWLAAMSYKAGGEGQPLPAPSMRPSVAVVMASAGYPYGEGEARFERIPESWLAESDGVVTFGASVTRSDQGHLLTGKGRVLTVVGTGQTLTSARDTTFQRVRTIAASWSSARWRSDIARKAAEEETFA